MNISGIALGGFQTNTTESAPGAAGRIGATSELAPNREARDSVNVASGDSRARALGILRQEIRQLLSANFRIGFFQAPAGYGDAQSGVSSDEVASEALNGARRLAARSPLAAGESLRALREDFENIGADVREIVGDDDADDLAEALGRVDDGLDDLEDDAARNVESFARVLSAETSLKQRSTIRIRTQEGDVVRLDLRRMERFSATDVELSDGNSVFVGTSVEMSSRTRMALKVNGDLNEAEMTAINNVIAQADAIAAEFFDGDFAAAFDMAAGIEFDTAQLERVNLRFREKQMSRVSFAELRQSPPAPTPEPDVGEVAIAPAPIPKQVPAGDVGPADEVAPEPAEVIEARPAAEPEAPGPEGNALDGFLDLLADFLDRTNEGFPGGADSYRFFYAESFKLELLKSVLLVGAPEESGQAAATAGSVIDAVSGEADED